MATAIVLPSCSESCGCVSLAIQKFLEDKQGFSKVIGIPVQYSRNDFLSAIKEYAEKVIQFYAGKLNHTVILRQNIPLLLAAILSFRAGQNGSKLDFRVLHEEPVSRELLLLKPGEVLQQLRIIH